MRHQPDMKVDTPTEGRRDDVFAWRRAQLVRAGFPQRLAARAAHDGHNDLHCLIELVERGCPPALALQILAPLEGDEAP